MDSTPPATASECTPPPTAEQLLADIRDLLAARAAPPVLLSATQVLALVGNGGESTLYKAVSRGDLPRPVATPFGPRWKPGDIERWVATLKPRRRRTKPEPSAGRP